MYKNLQRLLAALALLGMHAVSFAEISAATAEALMRKSGVWAQLGDIAKQVTAGVAQSPAVAALDAEHIKRLEDIAATAYEPARLRQTFLQEVSARMSMPQSVDAFKWYNSATGQLITRLEESSSASLSDAQRAMDVGNKVLAQASAKRYALLAQVVQATHAAESSVVMQINSTVAVAQGAAQSSSAARQASELRSMLEAQRPQMVAQTTGLMLTLFAATYQAADDKALEHYVKFLLSKSGSTLSTVMNDALDKSMSAAAQRLGDALSEPAGTTRL